MSMKLIQNSGIPIYQQIADAFRSDILSGKMQQGEYLPSIRGLAKELVTAIQGKGFCVNAQDSQMLQEQHMRRIEDSLTDAIKAARMAGISKTEVMKTFDLLWNMQE